MSSRDEWIGAAAGALAQGGVEAVRVEALARGLGMTKGSFYWHFADRGALLHALLERWEHDARESLASAGTGATPEERVAAFFRGIARPARGVADAEMFAWARRDRAVAERTSAVERARLAFLKEQLSQMGASLMDAHRLAEAGYLAAQAWIERAGRTPWMKSDYGAFINDVFRLLLRQPASPPA
jgi:AcrR family transcriptional regulator